jgi:hypothetical protein
VKDTKQMRDAMMLDVPNAFVQTLVLKKQKNCNENELRLTYSSIFVDEFTKVMWCKRKQQAKGLVHVHADSTICDIDHDNLILQEVC